MNGIITRLGYLQLAERVKGRLAKVEQQHTAPIDAAATSIFEIVKQAPAVHKYGGFGPEPTELKGKIARLLKAFGIGRAMIKFAKSYSRPAINLLPEPNPAVCATLYG